MAKAMDHSNPIGTLFLVTAPSTNRCPLAVRWMAESEYIPVLTLAHTTCHNEKKIGRINHGYY